MPGERRAVLSPLLLQLRPTARARRAALALLLGLAAPLPVAAQAPLEKLAPAPADAPAEQPSGEELREQLTAQRAALEQQRAELAARESEALPPDEERARAAELDAVDRTLSVLNDYLQLLAREALVAERNAARRPPEEVAELGPPPYGLDDLDPLEEALAEARRGAAALERNQELIREELEATRADLASREEARRKAREELSLVDGGEDPAAAVTARRALRLAELESRRAELRRDLVARAAKVTEAERALRVADLEALAAAAERVRADLRVSPEEIEARVAALDAREAKLAREQERSAARVADRETRLARAQRRLEAATGPAPGLAAEVAAYRAELQTERWRAALLRERMTQLSGQRELVRARARALGGELSRDELRAAAAKLAQEHDETRRMERIQETRLAGLREELERAQAEAERAEAGEVASWKEREARALAGAVDDLEAAVKTLRELGERQQRVAAAVEARVAGRGVAGALRRTLERAAGIWDEELASFDDRPITVGKIVIALAVLALGRLGAGSLSRLVGRLMRRRSHAAQGAAQSIERLSFYVFMALFLLIALRLVNIPLTAFTIAGGALAVGIGFGSQNILNNFISGIILLTERPIQVGDIVEVEGVQGAVERIGARSTRIRTFESVHLIVPNSAFLEKTVRNLTLSDDVARGLIDVGVAYGSNTREVQRLLRKVLSEHALVLDEPAPIVLFDSFGESALGFRCLFWIRDVLQRGSVASELRFRIDEVFREAGIELAFPQRDVHLDAKRVLPVRIVREDEPAPGA